jgi:multidrug efflux pump subunit AcrB
VGAALPPGFQVDWLSDSRQYVYEGNRLMVSFGFALVVIFLVLAAQFESFRDPLVILGAVPLAVCGDAQREMTSARSALAASDQQLGSLRVVLFKALGGG